MLFSGLKGPLQCQTILSKVCPSGNKAPYPGNVHGTIYPLSLKVPQDHVIQQQQNMELP